jgi:lipoprotein-releasing system ATP-binding protein
VTVAGERITGISVERRAAIRNRHMGFVYQLHHLLPEFTALENVGIPLRLRGVGRSEAAERAAQMLNDVGLGARLAHRPAALSGGERQRVAVARALVGAPSVVLADEPTGNLDQDNASHVFELMCGLSNSRGIALVVVTHDDGMARAMDRILRLEHGTLI